MIRTCVAHVTLCVIVIMLAAQIPISSSYSCMEQCRTNLSAGVAQCQQQNTSFYNYNLINVCFDQAHNEYDSCTLRCPQRTMGPHRLPAEQIEPLPGYIPRTYR